LFAIVRRGTAAAKIHRAWRDSRAKVGVERGRVCSSVDLNI